MQIALIGSLMVMTCGGIAEITAPQQRVLVAALAVDAGCVVPAEKLAAAIWERPPAGWPKLLPPLIRRLRVSLGEDSRLIHTSGGGYLLGIERQQVDIHAFESLRKAGLKASQARDWELASQILSEAERLWRGTPFVDIKSAKLREDWQGYLENLHRQVQVDRIEADVRISLATARSTVADLKKMVAADPADERLRALHMLALVRSGKPAEAQTAFRDAWSYIRRELGTTPDAVLRSLNERIIGSGVGLLSEPFDEKL